MSSNLQSTFISYCLLELHILYSHRRNTNIRDCSKGFEQMTKDIDDWDVDNGFEFSKELISNHGTKHGAEVAEHREGVVDTGASVMVKMQFLANVDT